MQFPSRRACFAPSLAPRPTARARWRCCAQRPDAPPAPAGGGQAAKAPPAKAPAKVRVEEEEPPPRMSNPEVVAERFVDTCSDAYLHFARKFNLQAPDAGTPLGRVVVLGSGWGAHSLMKVVDMSRIQSLTIISPRNFFFFTPLLSATAVGTIEFRSIVEPMRAANPDAEFFEAFADNVDVERKMVRCRPGQREGYPTEGVEPFEVPYDTLVVAVGETTSTFGVTGARKYANFLKEIGDARKLRAKILDSIEKAALPCWTDDERRDILRFVVCGGGPTGTEFAGELSDFVTNLEGRYGPEFTSLIEVVLLQSRDSLLTQFEESLQQLASDNFEERVRIVFKARVVEVTESEIFLQDGRTLRYGMLVWAAGNGTRPLVGNLIETVEDGITAEEAISKRRKLVIDPYLRVKGAKDILALGDCTILESNPLPSTAQVAGQQGAYLGRLLSRAKSIETPLAPVPRDDERKKVSPFNFLSLGVMAYIGNKKAVVQIDTVDNQNITVGGWIAYVLWRSVYAVKQVDARSRVLVLLDYLKARVWGRDLSRF